MFRPDQPAAASRSLLAEQFTRMRERFAQVTNSEPAAFGRDGVTITSRPEPAAWPFTGAAVSLGAGAVWCVEEAFVEWARTHAPPPRQAAYVGYRLAAEGERRGETLHAGPPTLAWALSQEPQVPTLPDGYRLERVDRDRMNLWQARSLLPNALGLATQAHRSFRNQFAFAATDAAGEPAAVAGAYDTAGLSEIGVDVRRDHRGHGLAVSVVRAVAREILATGELAFYECAVDNTRSQRTALACGFIPVGSIALVYRAGLGMEDVTAG